MQINTRKLTAGIWLSLCFLNGPGIANDPLRSSGRLIESSNIQLNQATSTADHPITIESSAAIPVSENKADHLSLS